MEFGNNEIKLKVIEESEITGEDVTAEELGLEGGANIEAYLETVIKKKMGECSPPFTEMQCQTEYGLLFDTEASCRNAKEWL